MVPVWRLTIGGGPTIELYAGDIGILKESQSERASHREARLNTKGDDLSRQAD